MANTNKLCGLEPITYEQYIQTLSSQDEDKALRAFNKAWEIRNFEIEMYWKRATYFWAFIASTFAGYLAISTSIPYNSDYSFLLACIGVILSLAWLLTNEGSKTWQRHWEVHVDLLEDRFTGPLYKTVHPQKTFSVSKINEIVSFSFVAIWCVLFVKTCIGVTPSWYVFLAGQAVILYSLYLMVIGYGRGLFSERNVIMHKRKIKYNGKSIS